MSASAAAISAPPTPRYRWAAPSCRSSGPAPASPFATSTDSRGVAAEDESQMIPEVRLEPARPLALSRLLPLRRLHHVGIRQVVEGHVFAVSAGAAEASSAEDARHGAEGGDVLLVVPLVELRLPLGGDVHGVQEQP